ncbi:MAG: 4-(cytidine 5'-diphospho)-2-C-methyl-D-erythritol kinase [Desulfobacteraceae bacterium]|nr:4-(cytidine 5'-diphospho)-2-C-methyl-D-erythritol kinase [Desulfobacteraceae bacterium]
MLKNTLEIATPAKINLFLHITGKRDDGYHELCSLMCAIGLYDTLQLDLNADKLRMVCNHPDVPGDETNLTARAAKLFLEKLEIEKGIRHPGVSITLVKNIPVGAGLGGGSSNAAGVLSGLNQLFDYPFSSDRLMAMGLQIGADVPFFIHGKPAIATGVGEQLQPYDRLRPCTVLLIFPGFPVSTAWVYKNLKLGLTKPRKQLNYQPFDGLIFQAGRHLNNDLEAVTAEKYEIIDRIKKYLISSGADGALMSGSGPTVFGLYSDGQTALDAKANYPDRVDEKIFLANLLL